jgi:UDP-N-acetylmuramate dehydrogenase
VKVLESVQLSARSTMGVGGPARYFVSAEDEATALEAVAWADRHRVPLRVLGGGSNLVIADGGFDGLVLRIAIRGRNVRRDGPSVEIDAGAGEAWDPFVAWTVSEGWAGLECLSGIPGLVGATPIQNVGAYGQEVSETITGVRALDRRGGLVELSPKTCRFGYRDSLFKSGEPGRYIVLSVHFRLTAGKEPRLTYPELERHVAARGSATPTLAEVRESVLAIRAAKSMVIDAADENRRSCGSFFTNPVVSADEARAVAERAADPALPQFPQPDGRIKLSAAWLIEKAGFSRGQRLGACGISSRHSLALVCHDGARASDVVALARRVRNGVEGRFGVRLIPEPVFWGFQSLDDGLPDDRLV